MDAGSNPLTIVVFRIAGFFSENRFSPDLLSRSPQRRLQKPHTLAAGGCTLTTAEPSRLQRAVVKNEDVRLRVDLHRNLQQIEKYKIGTTVLDKASCE